MARHRMYEAFPNSDISQWFKYHLSEATRYGERRLFSMALDHLCDALACANALQSPPRVSIALALIAKTRSAIARRNKSPENTEF